VTLTKGVFFRSLPFERVPEQLVSPPTHQVEARRHRHLVCQSPEHDFDTYLRVGEHVSEELGPHGRRAELGLVRTHNNESPYRAGACDSAEEVEAVVVEVAVLDVEVHLERLIVSSPSRVQVVRLTPPHEPQSTHAHDVHRQQSLLAHGVVESDVPAGKGEGNESESVRVAQLVECVEVDGVGK